MRRSPLWLFLMPVFWGALCVLVLLFLAIVCTPCSRDLKKDEALLDLLTLQYALRDYHARHHRLPSPEEGLQALLPGLPSAAILSDPWGRPYRYVPREGAPLVWSNGADGLPGGEDEDEDLWCQAPLRGHGCSAWFRPGLGPLGGSVRPPS